MVAAICFGNLIGQSYCISSVITLFMDDYTLVRLFSWPIFLIISIRLNKVLSVLFLLAVVLLVVLLVLGILEEVPWKIMTLSWRSLWLSLWLAWLLWLLLFIKKVSETFIFSMQSWVLVFSDSNLLLANLWLKWPSQFKNLSLLTWWWFWVNCLVLSETTSVPLNVIIFFWKIHS